MSISSTALTLGFESSKDKARGITAATTPVGYVWLRGRCYQVQVVVTSDKSEWFDIRRAGIKSHD